MLGQEQIAIVTMDASGVIRHINRPALALFNQSAAPLGDFHIESIIDFGETPLAERVAGCADEAISSEVRGIKPCGGRFDMNIQMECCRSGVIIMCEEKNAELDMSDPELLRRLSHVIESAQLGTYEIDLRGGTSTVCEHWLKQMGYKAQPEDPHRAFERRVHPEDRAIVRKALSDCIAGRAQRTEIEFRIRRVGECDWRWMRSNATVIRHDADGTPLTLMGVQCDITEKKLAQSELQQSEHRFRAAMERSPIGMALSTMDGKWLDVNPALCEFLGYPREELMRKGFRQVTLVRDREATIQSARELVRSGQNSMTIEKKYLHASGELLTGQLSLTVVRDDMGAPQMFLSQIVDITEARKLDFMKSEFISTVNHELRTPVTSILGALSLLEGLYTDAPASKETALIAIAQRNGLRLKNLLNDILQVSSLTSGSSIKEKIPVSLKEAVDQAQEAARDQAAEFDVKIEAPLMDPALKCVTDPDMLSQVLRILLSNATKFSDPKSVVTVEISAMGAYNRVTISNKGSPIPHNFRKVIFQSFVQSDKTDTRRREGSGLGLSIAKKILDQLDGRIDYHSDETGTSFWFDLPAHGSNVVLMAG